MVSKTGSKSRSLSGLTYTHLLRCTYHQEMLDPSMDPGSPGTRGGAVGMYHARPRS